MITVILDIFDKIVFFRKWEILDLENDLKRLNAGWHSPAPYYASFE